MHKEPGLFARCLRSPYSPMHWPSFSGSSPFITSNHPMADQGTKPVALIKHLSRRRCLSIFPQSDMLSMSSQQHGGTDDSIT